MYLVIDTETNGLMDFARPAEAPGQPRVAEFAAILLTADGRIESEYQRYVKPDGWAMSPETTKINGITDDILHEHGVPIGEVLDFYSQHVQMGRAVIAYGAQFDCKMMRAELFHYGRDKLFEVTPNICLMRAARPFAKQIGRPLIKHGFNADGTPVNQKGWPKLSDLCRFLDVKQTETHEAHDDARATAACFVAMLALGFKPEAEVHYAKDHEAIRSAP